MRVLITGGAGYLGQVLARTLVERGESVVVLDSLLYSRGSERPFGDLGIEFRIGDVRDPRALSVAAKGSDVIVHLAAIVGEPACGVDTSYSKSINLDSTEFILRAAAESSAELYVASTCSVFGEKGDVQYNTAPERSSLLPPYAAQKARLEEQVAQSDYLKTHVLRFASLFGVSPRPRHDLVINRFAANVAKGLPIIVNGSGRELRPFLSVSDAAEIVAALIARGPASEREILTIGRNDQNMSIRQVAERFAALFGSETQFGPYQNAGDSRSYAVEFEESAFPERLSSFDSELSLLVETPFNHTPFYLENVDGVRKALGKS